MHLFPVQDNFIVDFIGNGTWQRTYEILPDHKGIAWNN